MSTSSFKATAETAVSENNESVDIAVSPKITLRSLVDILQTLTGISQRERILCERLLGGIIPDPDRAAAMLRKFFSGFVSSKTERMVQLRNEVLSPDNAESIRQNCQKLIEEFGIADAWLNAVPAGSPLYLSKEEIETIQEYRKAEDAVSLLFFLFRMVFREIESEEVYQENLFYSALGNYPKHRIRQNMLQESGVPLALTIAANEMENTVKIGDIRKSAASNAGNAKEKKNYDPDTPVSWQLYMEAAEQKEKLALWNQIYYVRISLRNYIPISKENIADLFRKNYIKKRISDVSDDPCLRITDSYSTEHKKCALLLYSLLKEKFAKAMTSLGLMFKTGEIKGEITLDGQEYSGKDASRKLLHMALKNGDMAVIRNLIDDYIEDLEPLSADSLSAMRQYAAFDFEYIQSLIDVGLEMGFDYRAIRLKYLTNDRNLDKDDIEILENVIETSNSAILFMYMDSQMKEMSHLIETAKMELEDQEKMKKAMSGITKKLNELSGKWPKGVPDAYTDDIVNFIGSRELLAMQFLRCGKIETAKVLWQQIEEYATERNRLDNRDYLRACRNVRDKLIELQTSPVSEFSTKDRMILGKRSTSDGDDLLWNISEVSDSEITVACKTQFNQIALTEQETEFLKKCIVLKWQEATIIRIPRPVLDSSREICQVLHTD